jgi:anti-anti-sigma factor
MPGRGLQERKQIVVTAAGEVDVSNAHELQAEIDQALQANARATELVLDMAGVTFLDSSGVKCLMRAYRMMLVRGGHLVLREVQPPVLRVLELVGLGRLFTICPASAAPPADATPSPAEASPSPVAS